MQEAIENFAEQFEYEPEVANSEKLLDFKKFIICGMGGSHLSADILKSLLENDEISIEVYKNYGLPQSKNLVETLFIASSFSGNTEEVLDFAEKVFNSGLPLAIVTKGGVLLNFAQDKGLPHVELPKTNIQPRMALGYSILALAKILKKEDIITDLRELKNLNSAVLASEGERLGQILKDKIPVVYSSERNKTIAYNWKIKFNETGKVPAFFNVFPELNHNEMTGYDTSLEKARKLHFIFLKDEGDYEKIQKRMEITAGLLKEKNYEVEEIVIEGSDRKQKIFNALLLADWTSLSLAKIYGHDPDKVPMVEEFKKKMKS